MRGVGASGGPDTSFSRELIQSETTGPESENDMGNGDEWDAKGEPFNLAEATRMLILFERKGRGRRRKP